MNCISLRLIQFRNFSDLFIEINGNFIILTGLNGIGKTNILESLYWISTGKSFRTNNEEEMISFEKEETSVILSFFRKELTNIIKFKLNKGNSKKIFINETAVRRKDILGLFSTVLFTSDELQLIKGNPYRRRRFLDMSISQISPRYDQECIKYNRAIQQRNAAFKNQSITGISENVEIWEMQIARSGAYIVEKRLESIKKINKYIQFISQTLTGKKENICIQYKQKESQNFHINEEWFLKKIWERRQNDIRFCQTSVGPHRDDIVFKMNELDLSIYGSQGQQKTAILAIKLAELDFIKEETGEYPVFLLDDIGNELDLFRQKALLSYLKQKKIQTIATATDNFFGNMGREIKIGTT